MQRMGNYLGKRKLCRGSGRQSASNYIRAASKVLQRKNGMYTDSREKKISYDIDKTKIKLLYHVLQKMVQGRLWRKHKRKRMS